MIRDFKYSDDVLAQYAQDMLSFLEDDLEDFTTFDPGLGEERRNRLTELVNWALTEGGDDQNVARLGNLTETLHSEMNRARRLYSQLRYWVIKTFPGQTAIQKQFGIGRFQKLTNTQSSFVSFFLTLADTIETYRQELEGSGAPGSLLNQAGEQARALTAAQNAQEKKKGNRTVDTEVRVGRLNELFGITREYNAAAEFVYFDSPAMRDRYRPPGSASTPPHDDDLFPESEEPVHADATPDGQAS